MPASSPSCFFFAACRLRANIRADSCADSMQRLFDGTLNRRLKSSRPNPMSATEVFRLAVLVDSLCFFHCGRDGARHGLVM